MSRYIPGGYPNRTLCDVLKEMRACYETRNFCSLMGLIEEAQSMGNRMESALEDVSDLKEIRKAIKEERETLKKLMDETKKLNKESLNE